jgi:hypothetical protein
LSFLLISILGQADHRFGHRNIRAVLTDRDRGQARFDLGSVHSPLGEVAKPRGRWPATTNSVVISIAKTMRTVEMAIQDIAKLRRFPN